jgi:hypothetical protein
MCVLVTICVYSVCDTKKLRAVLHTRVLVACAQIAKLESKTTNSELNTNKFQ